MSGREREVLGLVAKGKSNKEVANDLGITEATVKSHVSAILLRIESHRPNARGRDRTSARID